MPWWDSVRLHFASVLERTLVGTEVAAEARSSSTRGARHSQTTMKLLGPVKSQLACVACVVWSVGLLAQGTVDFNNSPGVIGGSGAPVFDVDGTTRLAGTSYLAQLYADPDAGSLSAWVIRSSSGRARARVSSTRRGLILPGASAPCRREIAGGGQQFSFCEPESHPPG